MSNIDKQALREAATEATQGGWYVDYDFDVCHESGAFIAETHGDSLVQNAKFIAAANPSTVLALLDELEAAVKQNAQDVQIKARLCRESNSLHDRLRDAEKRIAELEARTVTLPDRKSELFWPGNGFEFDNLGYVIAVENAIRAAGIKVKGE
ncbi:TPA: ead/Ea22-like family protein [Salmonella enterica subsp. enterica serovar Newport]